MIRLGLALKCQEAPHHRCVILSDTQGPNDYVVLVRITTDDGNWPDRRCLLGPSDWVELDRQSTVAYSTASIGKASVALEAAIRSGKFTVISSPPPAVLKRIIERGRGYKPMPPLAEKWMAVI